VGLPGSRTIFEQLQDALEIARRSRNVIAWWSEAVRSRGCGVCRPAHPVMNDTAGPQPMTSLVLGGFMSPSTVAMVGSW